MNSFVLWFEMYSFKKLYVIICMNTGTLGNWFWVYDNFFTETLSPLFFSILNVFSRWIIIDKATQKVRYFFSKKIFFEKEPRVILIVCYRNINLLPIFGRLFFTECLNAICMKFLKFFCASVIFLTWDILRIGLAH